MTMMCGALGATVTAKFVGEVAVPAAVTVIGPVPVAPLGTVVLILMSEFTVKAGWLVPLNATALAPVNPVPLITTGVPTGPLVGLKLLIVGAGATVTAKFVGEVAVPAAVTVIGPVPVAPLGTVVLILMSEFTVKAGWLVPLNATALAPVNPVPLITTGVPTGPLVGLKLLIVCAGAAVTAKFVGEVAVPAAVTVIGP